jgi:peptidoglycan hydrolase-like protein with peptidoglycan-binding domain
VRHRRSFLTVAAGLALSSAIAGCSGHSAPSATGPQPTATATAQPAALHVTAVTPRRLSGTHPITVNFAEPLSPESPLPTLDPKVPGTWARDGSSAVFTPRGAYPPDTRITVKVAKRVDAKSKPAASRMTPTGSLLRAQQILARLHYLPLKTTAPTLTTKAAESAAVYDPPAGSFAWRFPDTPKTIKNEWSPGASGEVLRGAVIAFQHLSNLPVDGSIGPMTWHALIKADLADKVDPDHYSYVDADLDLPQRLSVWVDGHTVLTSPVNGGVAGAPTPLGTFPVYERLTSTTMSGTNPDGSKYSDPGVPWVNYFSGGSAVHGFPRASYGSPQSVGCLELPIPTAEKVFNLIDYGTLVNVTGPPTPTTSGTPSPPSSPSPKPSKHSHG